MIKINRSKRLKGNQYYPVSHEKDCVFLHHTVGTTADGAIHWWNQTPSHVGTAYVIDRDGTIYECFDPCLWAYHLGIKGDTNNMERKSIGIEIVSAGQLYKANKDFIFYPIWPQKKPFTIIPPEEVTTIEKGWRGFNYFHKYTDEQIKSVCELLVHLEKSFKAINYQKEGLSKFYEFQPKLIDNYKSGLFSHSTVRKDKTDIFPQKNLIEAITKTLGNPKKQTTKNKTL